MLYGKPTLLMHGDLLCTGDVAYQQFRAQTRNPAWQQQFLSQPLAARLAFAQQARAASKAHQARPAATQGTMETITDVAPATVAATFARFGIDTHDPRPHPSPGDPRLDVDGHAYQRIVLGDWYDQGSVLRVDADGAKLASLVGAPRSARCSSSACGIHGSTEHRALRGAPTKAAPQLLQRRQFFVVEPRRAARLS